MGRKPKFKPRITRIKLNPEQAVLTCTCYAWEVRPGSHLVGVRAESWLMGVCSGPAKFTTNLIKSYTPAGGDSGHLAEAGVASS